MNLLNSKNIFEPAFTYVNKMDNQNQLLILLQENNHKCANHISYKPIYKAIKRLNKDSEKGELSFIEYSYSNTLEGKCEQSLGTEFYERTNYIIIGEKYLLHYNGKSVTLQDRNNLSYILDYKHQKLIFSKVLVSNNDELCINKSSVSRMSTYKRNVFIELIYTHFSYSKCKQIHFVGVANIDIGLLIAKIKKLYLPDKEVEIKIYNLQTKSAEEKWRFDCIRGFEKEITTDQSLIPLINENKNDELKEKESDYISKSFKMNISRNKYLINLVELSDKMASQYIRLNFKYAIKCIKKSEFIHNQLYTSKSQKLLESKKESLYKTICIDFNSQEYYKQEISLSIKPNLSIINDVSKLIPLTDSCKQSQRKRNKKDRNKKSRRCCSYKESDGNSERKSEESGSRRSSNRGSSREESKGSRRNRRQRSISNNKNSKESRSNRNNHEEDSSENEKDSSNDTLKLFLFV